MAFYCEDCDGKLEHAFDGTNKHQHELAIVEYYRCPACNVLYTVKTPVDLNHWIDRFSGIQSKTRELWQAIRWEFEVQQPPMTVRQSFYRMSNAAVVHKTEQGYRKVQYALLKMRRAGAIPYGWIADSTRWVRKPNTFSSMSEALTSWQQNYRRALWDSQPVYVEIWMEKEALAGVFAPVTNEYDVPLYVTRGYSSETFIYEAAQSLTDIHKPIYIYHFGDYDPSGRDAARDIADKLRGFGAEFKFIEAAVTADQVRDMNLQTRPTKRSDSRTKKWTGGGSVELDAIEPSVLRRMVRDVIERHIDTDELAMARQIEAQERARIIEMASRFGTSPKSA